MKQPALCYQGKGLLFKVSGLDGFWASKSQSLFSTHHFYRIGWKSVIQILQREKERGRAAAIPVQASLPCCSVSSIIHPLVCEIQSFMLQIELKKGCLPYRIPEQLQCNFNEHNYLILMLNLVKYVLIFNTIKSCFM